MSIRFTPQNLLAAAIACALSAGTFNQALRADTVAWSGATSGAWATAANWSTDAGHNPPTATDIASFTLSANPNQPVIAANTAIGGLVFTGTGITTLSATAGTLTIGGSGISMSDPVSSTAGAVTISAPLALSTAQLWQNTSSSLLTLSSATAINGAGQNLTLSTTTGGITLTSGTSTLASLIIDANNTGTITVSNLTGGTNGIFLENGKLVTTAATTLLGGVTFGSATTAATLDVSGNSITVDGLHMDPSAAIGNIITNSGTTGKILTVDTSAEDSLFSGVVQNGSPSSTLGLNKAGNNTLTLTGINTYTGNTSGTHGTIEYVGQAGSSAQNLGTLSFTGLNIGGTTVGAGVNIQSTYDSSIDSTHTTALNFTGTLTHSPGSTVDFIDSGGGANNNISVGTASTGAGAIVGAWVTFDAGASTRYAIQTGGVLGGFTTSNTSDINTINSAAANFDSTGFTTNNVLTANATGNTIRYTGGGQTIDTATNTEKLTLNGILNAGTGTLTINGITTNGTDGVVVGSSNELVVDAANADIELGAVSATGTQTLTLTGPHKIFLNNVTNTSTTAANFTIDNGFTNANGLYIGASRSLVFTKATGTGNLAINVPVYDNPSGSSSVTVAGAGSIAFSGGAAGSLFTGNLNIETTGSVSVVDAVLNQDNDVVINAGGSLGFGLGGPAYIAGLDDHTASQSSSITGGSVGITNGRALVLSGSGTYNFSGVINGSTVLIKSGSGTQVLSGKNVFTSGALDSGGTLQLDFSQGAASGVHPLSNILYNGVAPAAMTFGGGNLLISGNATSAVRQDLGSIAVGGGTSNTGSSLVKLVSVGQDELLSTAIVTFATGNTVDFTLPSGSPTATNGILITTGNTNGILGLGNVTLGGKDWATSGAPAPITAVSWSNTAGGPLIINNGTQANGTALSFNTAPTGLTAGQLYYVVGQTGTQFNVATTPGGAAITVATGASGAGATINDQGNITAYAAYTPFVGTTSTTTANYLIDPTIPDGNGTDVVTATETFNSLKINPSTSGQTLTINASQTLTLATGLLFTGTNDYSINTGAGATPGKLTGANLIIQQFAAANNLTIGATITGTTLTKAGPGTLTLTAANAITGSVFLNGGVTNINTLAALGTGSTIAINGGTLQYATGFTGSGDITKTTGGAFRTFLLNSNGAVIDTNGNNITWANGYSSFVNQVENPVSSFTKTGAGTLSVLGPAGYMGPTTISGGVLEIGGGVNIPTLDIFENLGSTGAAGSLTGSFPAGSVAVGQSVTGGRAGVFVASVTTSSISFSNGTSGGGQLIIGGFSGINDGGAGNSSSIGVSSAAPANLVLDGGTLRYIGSTQSTDRLFTVTSNGGGLDASGTGALTFSSPGAIVFGNGTPTLTLTGNTNGTGAGNGTGILSPVISNGTSGVTSVTKSGAGTWILTATNTYTGITTITGGTLALSSANNNIAGSSKIIVGDSLADAGAKLDVTGVTNGFVLGGSQTLAGHGTVVGNVTTSSGSVLAPGNTIGTTSYSANLTLAAGTVLDYEFAGSSSSDDSLVAGLLTLPTGTGSITLNMTDAGGLTAGTFKIFGYGTLTGGAPSSLNATFAIDPPSSPSLAGATYDVVNNAGSSELDLVISGTAVPEPASLALLGLGAAGLLLRRRRRA